MPFQPIPVEEKKIHLAHLYASPDECESWEQAYWSTVEQHRMSKSAWILALAQAALDAGVDITEEQS